MISFNRHDVRAVNEDEELGDGGRLVVMVVFVVFGMECSLSLDGCRPGNAISPIIAHNRCNGGLNMELHVSIRFHAV